MLKSLNVVQKVFLSLCVIVIGLFLQRSFVHAQETKVAVPLGCESNGRTFPVGAMECSGVQGRTCQSNGQWGSRVNAHGCGYVGATSCTGTNRRFIGCGAQTCGTGGYVNCFENCSNNQGTCQAVCECQVGYSCGVNTMGTNTNVGNVGPGTMPNCSVSQPSNPPTTPSNPPISNPSPVASPASPTVSCAKLEVWNETGSAILTTSPAVGEKVRFRCVHQGNTPPVKYFFTYHDDPTQALRLIYEGASDITFPIVVQPYMTVQCNPCISGVCSSNESVVTNCTYSRVPAPSPTPSPTPGPMCLNVAMQDTGTSVTVTQPSVGQSISLVCGQVPGATGYIFQVEEPNGNFVALKALNNTNRSVPYIVPAQSGHFNVECQICTGADGSQCFAFTRGAGGGIK